jgi:GT2 family glycosyltransferase
LNFNELNAAHTHDFLLSKMSRFVLSVKKLNIQDYQYLFCSICPQNEIIKDKRDYAHGIDIVIPTRNTPLIQLKFCLKSLQSEIEPQDRIFLVDDNNQPDLTLAMFKDLSLPIILLRGRCQGVAAARNIGAKPGNNGLVLFVDSDDYVMPGFIAKQRQFHENHSFIGATGTWLQAFGAHARIYPQWENFSPLSIATCLPPAGVLMWKRDVLASLNFFQEKFTDGFEDFDLVARATLHRIPILILDEILYMYRRGHTSLSQSWDFAQELDLRFEVNLHLQNLCKHEFKDYLELNSKFGSAMFQSNPDLIFAKQSGLLHPFILPLYVILILLPKPLKRFLAIGPLRLFFSTGDLRRIKQDLSITLLTFKKNSMLQIIWSKLPTFVKYFLLKKYF